MTDQNFYELRNCGVTSFQVLSEGECNRLIQEASSYTFKVAKQHVGARNVEQRFSEITIDRNRSAHIHKAVSSIQKYISTKIVEYGGGQCFKTPLDFQEIRVHKYPVGGFLTYHRDHKEFKNIIVSVLLRGESCFYVADDSGGTNERLIEAKIGYAIVLATSGFFGKNIQPNHCIANVATERWSLGMRDGIFVQ